MKIIGLATPCDFSEAGVEQAIINLRNASGREVYSLHLYVSVFDVDLAASMIIDKKYFSAIRYVTITPEFREGEWSVVDEYNEITLKSGVNL